MGEEQTGHIQTIGLTLYMEFLESAVANLKAGKQLDFKQLLLRGSEVDLGISALIPDNYIHDVYTRLTLYKRIANALDNNALRELQIEMIDRFGLLPEALKNLFIITEIKLIAQTLGICKITVNSQFGRFEFNKEPNIDAIKLIKLIQLQPQIYKLENTEKLRFFLTNSAPANRIDTVIALMKKLKK